VCNDVQRKRGSIERLGAMFGFDGAAVDGISFHVACTDGRMEKVVWSRWSHWSKWKEPIQGKAADKRAVELAGSIGIALCLVYIHKGDRLTE